MIAYRMLCSCVSDNLGFSEKSHKITELAESASTSDREWLESIDSVLRVHGAERAHYLLERVIDYTRRSGAHLPFKPNTAYVNTISTAQEQEYPGDRALDPRGAAALCTALQSSSARGSPSRYGEAQSLSRAKWRDNPSP